MSVIEYNMRIFVCLSVGSFRALYQEVVIQVCFLKLLLRYVYILFFLYLRSEETGSPVRGRRPSRQGDLFTVRSPKETDTIKAVGSLVNGCDEMSDYFRFMQCCQKLFLQSTNYMFFGYIIIFVGFTY